MERCSITYKILLFILLVINTTTVYGETELVNDDWDYATFKLYIDRKNLGTVKTICIGNAVFINLPDFMNALGYPFDSNPFQNEFSTCCPNASSCFSIKGYQLLQNDSASILSPEILLWDENNPYLLTVSLGELSTIPVEASIQSLRLKIGSKASFPKLVLQKQQEMREEIFRNREDLLLQNVDTIPLGLYRLSSVGYSISANFDKDGLTNYGGTLSAKGEFLKGSFELNYIRSSGGYVQNNQFNFKLDYKLDKKLLKQITLFRNYNTFTMDLQGYSNGVYISNNNKTFFDQRYYLYKGQSRPNSNVEVYNNKTLVSYVTTDSLGRFEVNIPVSNGANTISTVIPDSYGQAIYEEKTIYIPLNLLAKQKFNYALTAGYTDADRLFMGLYLDYGITDQLTATAMTESLIYHGKINSIGGLGFKLGLKEWFQLSGQYIPTVRYNFTLSGSVPKWGGYNIAYEQYNANQDKIGYAPLNSFTFNMNTQLPSFLLRLRVGLSMKRTEYSYGKLYNTSLRFNYNKKKISASFYINNRSTDNFGLDQLSYSGSVGYQINKHFYNDFYYTYTAMFKENQLRDRLQYKIGKRLWLSAETQYQTKTKNFSFQVGFSYHFPWITVESNFRTTGDDWYMSNSVSGGINIYDKRVNFTDQVLSGAALCVVLFADVDGNGIYSKEDKIIKNPKVIIKTGAEKYQDEKGVYFSNITPNRAFKLVIPRQPFKDISWQISSIDTCFCMAPCQSKTVYFPVKIVSEVTGTIYRMVNGKRITLRNISVSITSANGVVVKTRSDDDGVFDYIGLTVGVYKVSVCTPNVKVKDKKEYTIEIHKSDQGEYIENLDFELEK